MIQAPFADVDVTSAAFKANPFPFYAWLRAEAPAYRIELPGKRHAWVISRYDDVTAAFKDERLVKDVKRAMTGEQLAKQPWIPGFLKPAATNMLTTDEPDHGRLRGLVHKAFTPRLIENLRGQIQTITDDLLDRVQRDGQMDLIRDFALPLPVTVIAELLGVPRADQHKFHQWSAAMVASSAESGVRQMLVLPSLWSFLHYIRQLIQLRREHPAEDLTSALIQAQEAGDQLTEDELVGMIFLLLVAGHETTVNLIGNGVLALLEQPEQRERLVNDPALIRPAVEELARYYSPVEMGDERFTREDITIDGITIPHGELVYLGISSANRDEQQFPNADQLDLSRDPNRHLAFGQGIHYCLGSPLARMETQIAVSTLLRRMPELRLNTAPESLRWNKGIMLRGMKAMPVAF